MARCSRHYAWLAEIDAYPANAKLWEIAEGNKGDGIPREASEHIDGLFGSGSPFHRAHGFFIDGTDESTAKLPKGWTARSIVRRLGVDGRTVNAVAPAPEDLIVSKLARLDQKDRAFVEAYHSARPLDIALIEDQTASRRRISTQQWPREPSPISAASPVRNDLLR